MIQQNSLPPTNTFKMQKYQKTLYDSICSIKTKQTLYFVFTHELNKSLKYSQK